MDLSYKIVKLQNEIRRGFYGKLNKRDRDIREQGDNRIKGIGGVGYPISWCISEEYLKVLDGRGIKITGEYCLLFVSTPLRNGAVAEYRKIAQLGKPYQR